SDATLSSLSMKSSVFCEKFLHELFEIIFHSSKLISIIEKLKIALSGTDHLNIQEFVLTLSTLAPSIEFSDYNGNLPAIITSQQLLSFTLIEIQMNAQILNAIKQCFRTSKFNQVYQLLHYLLFRHCDGLKDQIYQLLIDNPTSLKVRSLRIIGKLTEYSLLLQKIGSHVENLVIELSFTTMKEMLLRMLL
ncbi:7149_t:CDS:2, partial [Funneliformis caledonium]